MSKKVRRKTVLSAKGKGGVNGSHNTMALATVLRLSAGDEFSTVLVDLDGSTGTAIAKMGERDANGEIKLEQSMSHGVPAFNM